MTTDDTFRIVALQHDADSGIISYPSASDAYFVLLAGDAVTNVTTRADARLGVDGMDGISDGGFAEANSRAFFRLMRIPVSAPLDQDEDGVDDVYELRNGMRPLDATDAGEDLDGDGLTNAEEYDQGLNANDPTDAPPADEPPSDAPPAEEPLQKLEIEWAVKDIVH